MRRSARRGRRSVWPLEPNGRILPRDRSGVIVSLEPKLAPIPVTNLVLRQLQGDRRELEAVLERQDRTQQLVVRLDQHMEARFAELRTSMAEIRSDAVLQENRLLARHNEILEILRRLDSSEPTEED